MAKGRGIYSGNKYDTADAAGTSEVAMSDVVPYIAPSYDTGRVEALTQELGAAGIGTLRRGLESGISSLQYTDNPWARKEQTRNLLAGYGEGIGGITTSARQGALSAYGTEYEAQAEAAKATWIEKMLREREQYASDVKAETAATTEGRGGSAISGKEGGGITYYNIPTPLARADIGASGGGKVGGAGWSENPWASTSGGSTSSITRSTDAEKEAWW